MSQDEEKNQMMKRRKKTKKRKNLHLSAPQRGRKKRKRGGRTEGDERNMGDEKLRHGRREQKMGLGRCQ